MSGNETDSGKTVTERELRKALAFSIGTKSVAIAYILWFFLGGLGVHRMYLGKTPSGIVMALLSVFGYLTVAILIGIIPLLVVLFWWIYDAFMIFSAAKKHNQTHDAIKAGT